MSEIKTLDVLRDWVSHIDENPHLGELTDTGKFGLRNIADAIQAEVDGRFMELPVDADGVPIHIGDMIEYEGDEDTYRLHARGVYVYEDGHVAVMNERLGIWYQENCRHVKPRTLEDVLNDLEGLSVVYMKYGDYASRVCELTDEMRELLGVDT